MAIIRKNQTTGEYYTRYNSNGAKTVHFYKFEMDRYLKKRKLKVGDDLPDTWSNSTKKFQYFHNTTNRRQIIRSEYQSNIFLTKCPICNSDVFFYSNENGSKVFFDEIGKPWPKHHCFNNEYSKIEKKHPSKKTWISAIAYQDSRTLFLIVEKYEQHENYIYIFFKKNNDFNLRIPLTNENLKLLESFSGHPVALSENNITLNVEMSCYNSKKVVYGIRDSRKQNSPKGTGHKVPKKEHIKKPVHGKKLPIKSIRKASIALCPKCLKEIFCFPHFESFVCFQKIGELWEKHTCDIDIKSLKKINISKKPCTMFERWIPITLQFVQQIDNVMEMHPNEYRDIKINTSSPHRDLIAKNKLYAIYIHHNRVVDIYMSCGKLRLQGKYISKLGRMRNKINKIKHKYKRKK